ncbi:hypothetical protein SAMN05443245_5603 [Paraburkholderia fungorum]|uniref:Uncharacterized protein n=1 Tax=Paraburkholderia fungorum TaxID=134537 RepID=A0A1H1ISN7_9BURK|nr:hypothetical protein SAMN05443245_5603 [Paraburkholderia fungorum]
MAHNEYALSHQEVVKAIIIDQHIHEGLWTLNINFNVEASHAPRVHDPTLTVTIKNVGIMRAPPTDPFAVDAALINPVPAEPVAETAQTATHANGANSTHLPDGSMQFCRDVYRSIAVQSAIKPRSKTS